MDYETKMKEREVVGEEREAVSGIKKLIKALRDFGGSEEAIYQRLIIDYGSKISPEKLKELMKETK